MNKFNNGKIYKITNDVNDECYIGSTCNTLTYRWSMHKVHYQSPKYQEIKVYKFMSDIGIEHFKIELVEEYPCETKEQILQREGYFINLFGTLNKNSAGTCFNPKEWSKKYRDTHKQEIIEYREANKEAQKNKNKEYYERNREKHLLKMCQKVMCECGKSVQRNKLKGHQQTKLHNKRLNLSQEPLNTEP